MLIIGFILFIRMHLRMNGKSGIQLADQYWRMENDFVSFPKYRTKKEPAALNMAQVVKL